MSFEEAGSIPRKQFLWNRIGWLREWCLPGRTLQVCAVPPFCDEGGM